MLAVKYVGRGTAIIPAGLPLGQDARLLNSYVKYTSPANGSPGMAPFAACMLIISELVDEFQVGERPSECAQQAAVTTHGRKSSNPARSRRVVRVLVVRADAVLFGQINAVTAAEGAIGGTAGYSGPLLSKYLLFTLYALYLVLLLITDLVPSNEFNSIWIVAILAFCTVSYFQLSERYANPMALRTRSSGQKPFVAMACRGTEVAITGIFSRAKSTIIGGNGGAETTAATAAKLGYTFTLGSRV